MGVFYLMPKITLTHALLDEAKTANNSYNSIQFKYLCKCLGISQKGWKQKAVGRNITEARYDFFKSLNSELAQSKDIRSIARRVDKIKCSPEIIYEMVCNADDSFRVSQYVKPTTKPKPKKSRKVKGRPKVVIKQGEYNKYLRSGSWKKFRQTILDLRGRECQLCQSKHDIQVHHMSYKRVGNEDIRDVLVVCGECHSFIHSRH